MKKNDETGHGISLEYYGTTSMKGSYFSYHYSIALTFRTQQ